MANRELTDTDTLTWDASVSGQAKGNVAFQLSIDSDVSGLKLSGDTATPGNNKVYGTNGIGVKGWQTPAGTGTVTSVAQSFTGGLISVAGSPITGTGTLALTVAGTSGGIPYFSGASTWASSGALTANLPVIGGGAGNAPTVGTRSGNTTQFGTITGTKTTGKQLAFDADGNVIASASDIGGGSASMSIGGGVTSGTTGSLLFVGAGPVLAQDNTGIFYDDTNNRLGMGTTSPSQRVDLRFNNAATNFGDGIVMVNASTATHSGAYLYAGANNNNVAAKFGADGLGTYSGTSGGIVDVDGSHPMLFTQGGTEKARYTGSSWTFASTVNVGIGATPSFPFHIQRSDNSTTGIQGRITNTNTSTHSFAILSLLGNNGSVVSLLESDGLGTGPLGAAGAYFGTFTNHALGFGTNNTLRMSISTAGVVNVANLTASRPVFTDGSKNLVSGSAGANFGPGAVTSITVVDGIVTAIS